MLPCLAFPTETHVKALIKIYPFFLFCLLTESGVSSCGPEGCAMLLVSVNGINLSTSALSRLYKLRPRYNSIMKLIRGSRGVGLGLIGLLAPESVLLTHVLH